jgi:hypothetical protein
MLSNMYEIRPCQVNSKTVTACVVTFHVGYIKGGHPMVRAYRCRYPNLLISSLDVPQGDQIPSEYVMELMRVLCPVLIDANALPDPT